MGEARKVLYDLKTKTELVGKVLVGESHSQVVRDEDNSSGVIIPRAVAPCRSRRRYILKVEKMEQPIGSSILHPAAGVCLYGQTTMIVGGGWWLATKSATFDGKCCRG